MARKLGSDGALVGETIGGIYRVQKIIGHGGMGEVYAADGPKGEAIAIKVLHARAAADPDLVARFHRESTIAKRIHSPYIAGIVGAGKEADGTLWIAFERLSGEGLDARLKREQYLSFGEVAPVVADTLRGLTSAHAAGVVHRDIKPANLFIERRELTPQQIERGESEERTRILDFGISKLRNTAGREFGEPSLTGFDATLGSFAYMAPEQVRGSARVDERADLYALGAVAFRSLTGRLPFEGANALTLIALKLDREAPSLTQTTGDEWPQTIERFLRRMMARDRDKRFVSAVEALDEWEQVSAQMAGVAPPEPRTARPLLAEPPTEQTAEQTAATFVDIPSPDPED